MIDCRQLWNIYKFVFLIFDEACVVLSKHVISTNSFLKYEQTPSNI